MSAEQQEERFRHAHAHNPWVAEPQIMLSQLLFDRGAFAESAHHAVEALETLCLLACLPACLLPSDAAPPQGLSGCNFPALGAFVDAQVGKQP
jgi:hypothetical protein